MKRIVAAAFFVLLPAQGFAKDQLRKFRLGGGTSGKPQVFLGAAMTMDPVDNKPRLLPAVGELVANQPQMVGGAKVVGTWTQTVFRPGGEVAYATGEIVDELPVAGTLRALEGELARGLQTGLASLPVLRSASKLFPASLEVRKNGRGEWQPHWRVEYLTPSGDQLRYVLLGQDGKSIEEGSLDWDGADGRAMVFPQGPKLSDVQEVTLKDLSGDGTVSGRLLKVFSALDLKVWSPQLTFFFNQDDRRFDLGQAYYTIEQGYNWLKDHLGVELDHPVSVQLHVGDGGVSNAAFYHQNTIYLGTGDGVTYKDMLRDPSVLIHEGIHAVIDSYAGLPSDGEGGGFNEGFADLFTALILENPRMGEASYQKGPYRRTLENNLVAYKDFTAGVYQNGSIVGGTFWDMKPILGTELTAKLAFKTLVRLGKGAKFDDFPAALTAAADGLLSASQKSAVLDIAHRRGWKVGQ